MGYITGEFQFRNEGDLLVLQVKEVRSSQYGTLEDKEKWRDAQTQDLLDIQFCNRDKMPEPIMAGQILGGTLHD